MSCDRPTLILPIADIAIGARIGFFNADHAKRLAESMAADGLLAPIQVRRNGNAAKRKWTLVAGLHRLRGAEHAGWQEIPAIQVADASATEAELRRLELSENSSHRFRRPIERAIMMVEQGRLEEALDHPGMAGEKAHARAARTRWNASAIVAQASPLHTSAIVADVSNAADGNASLSVMDALGWRDRTAKAFGCSLRALEMHQRLHRAIVEVMPDLAQALNDHPMGESLSAMTTLASFGMPDSRRKAAQMLLSRTDWKSMDQVLVAAGLARSTGSRVDADNPSKLLHYAWDKLSPAGRKKHVEWIAGQVTPGQAMTMVAAFKRRGLL